MFSFSLSTQFFDRRSINKQNNGEQLAIDSDVVVEIGEAIEIKEFSDHLENLSRYGLSLLPRVALRYRTVLGFFEGHVFVIYIC